MAKEKHYIHIAIEKEKWKKIKQIADSKEVSVSVIIRLLLDEYIKKEQKMNKKQKAIFKKTKLRAFIPTTQNSVPMYDLVIHIDKFFDKVKKNNNIPLEDKAQIINNFNKLLLQINDNFVRLSEKVGVEYDEPFSIKYLKNS